MHSQQIVTGSLITKSPLVYLLGVNGATDCPLSLASYDEFLSSNESMFFFFNPMWSLSRYGFREPVIGRLINIAKRFPQHHFTLLVNDPNELAFTVDLPSTIKVFVCGEHAAVDLKIFANTLLLPKPAYDAVYIARSQPYKRLELASKINRLCLISRGLNQSNIGYVKESIPAASIPNVENGAFRDLLPDEVAAILASSACGVILSEFEGQNRATIEYLLSGLPVVTTASKGGRDRFLTPANSVITQANAVAVADAVSFVRSTPFDKAAIRANAVEAVKRERKWLLHIMQSILEKNGISGINIANLPIPHHAFSKSDYVSSHLHKLG